MKKKQSRILCMVLSAVLVISLSACGGTDKVDSELSMAADVQKYIEKVDQEYAYGIAETLAYDEKYLSNELGFRTAGSDAEHAAAEYLFTEMENLGLAEIEKVPVTVDKWQFNDASLTIADSKVDIMPASYATNGTDEDGITAEIVDVGSGQAADYEGKDVRGKIVLAGIDQWNEFWIDSYMNEAYVHGAAAIVTYDTGGYATYSDEMINMQDLCGKDLIPCVSISKNQYKEIRSALKKDKNQATLTVDNEMIPEGGTSYNVIGKIKGKSSDQQILVSGHYDVYFNGFQDDSCAIGLVLAMAKAMKDADYTPENDIVFVCHGSEEWGGIDTQFDYTTGAWEMINTAHPEWAGKTLAMLNFELPAYYDGAEQAQISCVPEFASIVNTFVSDSGLCIDPANDIYPKGINSVSVDTNTMEDGVSYRGAGVPYFINIPGSQEGEDGWQQQRYHTVADDKDTYNADVMTTNLNLFGALAIYVDQTPALQVDLTLTCDDLEEALAEKIAKNADADVTAYQEAIDQLREASEGWNEKIADINTRYEEAIAAEASQDEINGIMAEGRELNKTTLQAFQYVQDQFIGIILSSDITVKHVPYQQNIKTLNGIVKALEKEELGNEEKTGALDLASTLNGGAEYSYYQLTKESVDITNETLQEASNPGNLFWGTGKGFTFADTTDATISLLEKAAALEAGETVVFDEELAVYRAALEAQREQLKKTMETETEAMHQLTEMLK